MRRWVERFEELGRAVIELLAAEVDGLGQDLSRAGRSYARAVVLLALGGAFAFWSLGVLTLSAVALLAERMSPWAAALVVGGSLLFIALALAGVGWWTVRRTEGPERILRRRLDNHLDWWHDQIVGQDEENRRHGEIQ